MLARRAFTLIDAVVTLVVISIVVLAAIPAFTADHGTRVVAAANLFVADLNNARALCVQNPSDPTSVVIGEAGLSYFLAKDSEPDTPIDLPYGEGGEYSVIFGEGDHTNLWGVTIVPEGVLAEDLKTGNLPRITFDTFGRLSPQTDVRFAVAAENTVLTVVIRADTGDAYIE